MEENQNESAAVPATPHAAPTAESPAQLAPATRSQRASVQVDDSQAGAVYSNFCRVSGTPEELIIDFGLNPQPFGVPTEPIKIGQRIVTNFYTAKRLMHALQLTIQRHEAVFGMLETDVQKRFSPAVRAAATPRS